MYYWAKRNDHRLLSGWTYSTSRAYTSVYHNPIPTLVVVYAMKLVISISWQRHIKACCRCEIDVEMNKRAKRTYRKRAQWETVGKSGYLTSLEYCGQKTLVIGKLNLYRLTYQRPNNQPNYIYISHQHAVLLLCRYAMGTLPGVTQHT